MRIKTIIFIILAILMLFLVYHVYTKKPVVPIVENNTEDVEDILTPQPGLPPAVEAKRQAIWKAARAQSYEQLASEASLNFSYSFGGPYPGGFIEYLKLSERDEVGYKLQGTFEIIPTLLRLPYAEKDGLYTWPSFFTVEPSKWTTEDIAMMKTFLTDKQIEDFKKFGGYLYYRLGITADGKWTFYIAGD